MADSPEELFANLLSDNWTRDNSNLEIPKLFLADNYGNEDELPGLFVFPLFEVNEAHHLNQKVNLEIPRIRVEFRSLNKFRRNDVKNEIVRIIISNNLNPTTQHWNSGDIQNIRYHQSLYKVEDSAGVRHYVTQVDFDCWIQFAY